MQLKFRVQRGPHEETFHLRWNENKSDFHFRYDRVPNTYTSTGVKFCFANIIRRWVTSDKEIIN